MQAKLLCSSIRQEIKETNIKKEELTLYSQMTLIFYIESLKEFTIQLSEFSNHRIEANIRKSIVFIYTSTKQMKNKI